MLLATRHRTVDEGDIDPPPQWRERSPDHIGDAESLGDQPRKFSEYRCVPVHAKIHLVSTPLENQQTGSRASALLHRACLLGPDCVISRR